MTNHQVRLAARPTGLPKPTDWQLTEEAVPEPKDGELLVKVEYISLDPAMRGWMNDAKSYIRPVAIGEVMRAGAGGRVVKSRHPKFKEGDLVTGGFGVQEFAISDGKGVNKVDTRFVPMTTYLGTLGMPGMTAYFGLLDVGKPQAGNTVVVSGAAGAVGSVVGQIAKIKGCRTVGIAGGPDKCKLLVDEFGFDAAIDYKHEDVKAALKQHCPNGIDVYFDNVGGDVLKAVLRLVNPLARIPLCGIISQYNAVEPPPGPNLGPVLVNRVTIRGFIVSDHADRLPPFLAECGRWVHDGRLKYREDIVDGLDNAPRAFIGLLQGKNFGKLLVKVGDDPTRR